MTFQPGDRVYLRGTVSEIAGSTAGIRVETGSDDEAGSKWPPLAERPVMVSLDMVVPAGGEYLSAADIAGHFGVPVNLVHTWRKRYGPDRTAEARAKAPSCPPPDVSVGRKKPQAGWHPDRLEEWAAWYASLPGRGAGGGRPRGARQVDDATLRRRAVKGWAFMDLPADENAAIKAFLNGGDPAGLPERWRRGYERELRLAAGG